MKISVITISMNSAATIEDALQSVAQQSYQEIEHIVIDGGSKDETIAIVKKFPKVKYISEPDAGLYDAMNKGIRMATGDVIGMLNSDDFLADPEVIEHVVNTLVEKNAAALYGDLQYVEEKDKSKCVRYWRSGTYKRDNFLRGWMPPHPTFYLRKEYYQQFGLYRTDMRISADYELMLRMLFKHGLTPVYLPEVMVKMRTGGKSNANLLQRLISNKEDRLAWKVNDLRPKSFTLVRKPLHKLSQYFNRP